MANTTRNFIAIENGRINGTTVHFRSSATRVYASCSYNKGYGYGWSAKPGQLKAIEVDAEVMKSLRANVAARKAGGLTSPSDSWAVLSDLPADIRAALSALPI